VGTRLYDVKRDEDFWLRVTGADVCLHGIISNTKSNSKKGGGKELWLVLDNKKKIPL